MPFIYINGLWPTQRLDIDMYTDAYYILA
jgi:hypothetical protein